MINCAPVTSFLLPAFILSVFNSTVVHIQKPKPLRNRQKRRHALIDCNWNELYFYLLKNDNISSHFKFIFYTIFHLYLTSVLRGHS